MCGLPWFACVNRPRTPRPTWLRLTVLIQFGLFVLGIGEYIFDPGLLHDLCAYVSLSGHMEDFSKGIVDSRRLLYDASSAIFCLFLTVRSVDSWRRA